MRRSVLFVALALTAVPAVAVAQTTFRLDAGGTATADAALTALRAEYAAAANAGDARRLSALYTADAISVPREGVMLRGSAEILRYSNEAFASVPAGAVVTLTPKTLESRGSMASETGTFSETRAGEGEPAATGVYVAVYTRDPDGAWRIAMEVRTTGRDKPVVRW